jgi:hypothetical protein
VSAWDGWIDDVLHDLGGFPGDAQHSLLAAWHACEGGTATFNPLNTTQKEAGSTQYNSAGVQNYPDQATGLRATVDTLRNGNYDGIVHDLSQTAYSATQIVIRNSAEFTTWGTSTSCLLTTLGATAPLTATKGGSRAPRRTVTVGQSDLPGTPSHLPGAWHDFTETFATDVRRATSGANRASKQFRKAVRVRKARA